MSIKIEGGGSRENVIKAGTSNELLYNDKEVLLKEKFGLLPPDLSKQKNVSLSGQGNPSRNPFIVPSDGWITDITANHASSCTIDGINGGPYVTFINSTPKSYLLSLGIPYPVKKGQAISTKDNAIVHITFAPCMSM